MKLTKLENRLFWGIALLSAFAAGLVAVGLYALFEIIRLS